MTASKTAQQVECFINEAKKYGFGIKVDNRLDIVRIEKTFTPGDMEAYVQADATAGMVLRHAPQIYPGTTWGTDGASVGGHAGMTGGYFEMKKSGIGRRFLKALSKELV